MMHTAPMDLPPLNSTPPGTSLVDAIYITLRDVIIRGDLSPGSRLREVALSEHFNVSTTPVRGALARLDFEGLIEIHPRRGAVVAAVSEVELRELYEIRELLECHALQAAVERGVEDLSVVDHLLDQQADAVARDEQELFDMLDLEFHEHLTGLGGNAEIQNMAQQTQRRIQAVRSRYALALPDQPRISHGEHLSIVNALREANAPRAATLLREHITAVRDRVLAAVSESAGRDESPSNPGEARRELG